MNFNPSQLDAISTDARTVLCVAGPGAGKSGTILGRIAALIRAGTDPRRIVVVTFTNNAAKNLVKRLQRDGVLAAGQSLGYCGTLHSFCLRLIQAHAAQLGLGSRISVIDESSAEALLDRCARNNRYRGTKEVLAAEVQRGPFAIRAGRYASVEQIVAAAYYETLRTSNMLDFDSILHYAAKLSGMVPSPFEHIMIDEGQDSGRLDAEIYNSILIPNKFVVADVDQAIFSFRKGCIDFVGNLATRPDVHQVRLELNYRSDQLICATAQRLIEHNKNRIAKRTVPVSTEPGSVESRTHDTPTHEAIAIIQDISRLSPIECAVLVRTNPLVEHFTNHLRAAGISVSNRSMAALPQDWFRTRTLLSLAANPANDVLAEHWITRYGEGEKAAQTARVAALRTGRSINAAAIGLGEPDPASVLETLGRFGASAESQQFLRQIMDAMPDGYTFSDLSLAVATRIDEITTEPNGVTVSTVHGAKGLEWSTVFLPAFEQGVLPLLRADTDLEEERRLAFVAVTRAKHRVVISRSAVRNTEWDSRMKPTEPSQFIAEMGL